MFWMQYNNAVSQVALDGRKSPHRLGDSHWQHYTGSLLYGLLAARLTQGGGAGAALGIQQGWPPGKQLLSVAGRPGVSQWAVLLSSWLGGPRVDCGGEGGDDGRVYRSAWQPRSSKLFRPGLSFPPALIASLVASPAVYSTAQVCWDRQHASANTTRPCGTGAIGQRVSW